MKKKTRKKFNLFFFFSRIFLLSLFHYFLLLILLFLHLLHIVHTAYARVSFILYLSILTRHNDEMGIISKLKLSLTFHHLHKRCARARAQTCAYLQMRFAFGTCTAGTTGVDLDFCDHAIFCMASSASASHRCLSKASSAACLCLV